MDEPTTSLTQREVDNLIQVVEDLQGAGRRGAVRQPQARRVHRSAARPSCSATARRSPWGPIAEFTKADLAF
jgi:simple sugar transport system ATP-binding protein